MKLGNGGNGRYGCSYTQTNCRCGLQCRLRWFALAVWQNWLQVNNVIKAIR